MMWLNMSKCIISRMLKYFHCHSQEVVCSSEMQLLATEVATLRAENAELSARRRRKPGVAAEQAERLRALASEVATLRAENAALAARDPGVDKPALAEASPDGLTERLNLEAGLHVLHKLSGVSICTHMVPLDRPTLSHCKQRQYLCELLVTLERMVFEPE